MRFEMFVAARRVRLAGLVVGACAVALAWTAASAAAFAEEQPSPEQPAKQQPAQPVQPVQPVATIDGVSVPQLLKNLDSDNIKVAASAARSLGVIFAPGGKGGEQQEQAVAMVIERLASPKGAALRRECATALGRVRAAGAADALQKAMSDEDIEVAQEAGEALAQILPVDEARALLARRAVEDVESVKAACYHGLAAICKAEDAPVLVKGLGVKNWRIQQDAVRGLERAAHAGAVLAPADYDAAAGVLGADFLNAADAALHFFTHVRNEASFAALLRAAEKRGDGSEKDVSWRDRAYALRAIYHLGWPSTKEALPVVIRNLGDRTANVTQEAKRIITTLRKEQSISTDDLFPLLLAELEQAEGLRLRAGIMREMGDHVDRRFASRVAKIAAETLADALVDKEEWPARAASLTLLGAAGYTGSMERIAQCVADDVSNVRQAAGDALEELAPLCPAEDKAQVAALLTPLLTNAVDWRKTTVAARASAYYPAPEAVEPLVRLLGHGVLNVREDAGFALAKLAGDAKSPLREPIAAAVFPEVTGNPKSWEFGAGVLGALGDVKAVPVLTTILQGDDWRAQAAAAKAVSQLASANKIGDKALSDALIAAAQSEVLQVQDAANQALRDLNKQ